MASRRLNCLLVVRKAFNRRLNSCCWQKKKLIFARLAFSVIVSFSLVFSGQYVYDWFFRRREIGPSIKYVSVCPEVLLGDHRLGNHLYIFSAVSYLAQLTRRRIAMPRDGWVLDDTFETDVTRVEDVERDICPCQTLDVEHYDVDRRLIDDEEFVDELRRSVKTILVCGLSQTFRYAGAIENGLQSRIRFAPGVTRAREEFLLNSVRRKTEVREIDDDADDGAFLVGVHIRRGDFLQPMHAEFGLTVINRDYLVNAFRYFTSRHKRAVFVVATDDWTWTLANLPANETDAEIVLSNNTAAVDLAVLSNCDAVIISTGSFGWWAAWFANRTTVYYPDWPRNGSNFRKLLNRENYFPRHWIPIV